MHGGKSKLTWVEFLNGDHLNSLWVTKGQYLYKRCFVSNFWSFRWKMFCYCFRVFLMCINYKIFSFLRIMLCHSNYYTMCKCNHQSSFYKLFPIRKKTKIRWFQLYYLTSIVWQYHIPNRLILIARFLSLTFPYPRGSLIYRDKKRK